MSAVASPPRVVLEARARLGEGPVWDDRTRTLFWIDIYNHRVHQFFPDRGTERVFPVGDVIGSLALTASARLIVALRHQLASLDLETGRLQRLVGVEEDRPRNRLNDGKCDPQGRFWFGSMSREEGQAALYRYDPDGRVHQVETGFTVCNGPAWSPDGSVFYLADSPKRVIYAYDFDSGSGELRNRRPFVTLGDSGPVPDGMTVDAEGYLWSAQWDGHGLLRISPDGGSQERIPIPVQRPTSCAFGGRERRHLYVTSASVELSEEELEKSFHSGDLFCLETTVAGMPFHRFGG